MSGLALMSSFKGARPCCALNSFSKRFSSPFKVAELMSSIGESQDGRSRATRVYKEFVSLG